MVLDRVRQWLLGAPGMAEVESLAVDYYPAEPGNGSIGPAGLTEVARREDVLGNVAVEQTMSFQVSFVMVKDESDDALATRNAQWLLDLQRWVQAQSLGRLAPTFGDLPRREWVRAEDGALKEVSQEGTAVYAVRLTFGFIKMYEVM
ncbi:MAG: hypothetical protein IJW45_05395 [Oscillospiraceae bacterium]|nr:hypothetical protein [Oscillospiraceae bacterium]